MAPVITRRQLTSSCTATQERPAAPVTMTLPDVLLALAERPVGPAHEAVVERELARLSRREVARG